MQGLFLQERTSPKEQAFNTEMSSVSTLVKNNYSNFKQVWFSQVYVRNFEVGHDPIGLLVRGSAITQL